MPATLVQCAAGVSNSLPLPEMPTSGNFLVVMKAHRSDPSDPGAPASGFELRAVNQFMTGSGDRRGVCIWTKVSDGTEGSFNTEWATSTTGLGGIVMEFETVGDVSFFDAEGINSGVDHVNDLTCEVPDPATASSIAIGAAVSRGSDALTDWDKGFSSPACERDQMGVAWRNDAADVDDNEVTLTKTSGDELNIVVVVFTVGSWSISGTVEKDSTAVEGAKVIVVDAEDYENIDGAVVRTVETTDAEGEYEATLPLGRIAFPVAVHKDGEDLYTSRAHGWIEEPEEE